jgi:diguanylate cyclase (GGDEF)-like protein
MRLLLLEDNQDLADTLAAGLSQLDGGYEIRWAAKLEDAKAMVRAQPPEIALIDLSLPDADGCEAALALRRLAPDLPLVALTGKDFDSVALELADIGVQDYLQKGSTPVVRLHQVLQLAATRHKREAELRREACHDPLTGAMNRAELERQLTKALSHADRTGYRGAVMLIDIDDFKSINDAYGHQMGDEVLKEIVKRLTAITRSGDSVARLGGDELVVILEGLNDRADAATVARKAVERTCYEISVNGSRLRVSTSIGIALFPEQGNSFHLLLEAADQAMYTAKRRGKSTYSFYAPP